jgi:hypothetical protein
MLYAFYSLYRKFLRKCNLKTYVYGYCLIQECPPFCEYVRSLFLQECLLYRNSNECGRYRNKHRNRNGNGNRIHRKFRHCSRSICDYARFASLYQIHNNAYVNSILFYLLQDFRFCFPVLYCAKTINIIYFQSARFNLTGFQPVRFWRFENNPPLKRQVLERGRNIQLPATKVAGLYDACFYFSRL